MRLVVDTIHADVDRVPRSTPSVAGYTTGTPDIRWNALDWERFKGAKIRINQSPASTYEEILDCDVFDIEPGAWTIPQAIRAAQLRRAHGLESTFYFPASYLPAVRAAVAAAGLDEHVWLFPANWNLSAVEAAALLRDRIVAVQFASPSSNPHTQLPGSRLTLSQANCDLSVAVDWWKPVPSSHKTPLHKKIAKPHKKVVAGVGGGGLGVAILHALAGAHVHVTATEAQLITIAAAAITAYLTPQAKR